MAITDVTRLMESDDVQNMGSLLQNNYYIGAVPTYNAMRCSDRKSLGCDCSVCFATCPMGIYPEGKRKKPVWTQCLKCGICAANCPDRCITPPAARVEQFLMAAAKKGETGICCREDSMALGLAVSCIAAISWEQMAYLALGEGLVISLKHCAVCENTNLKMLIMQNLEQLRFFLGDELFEKKVKILQGNDTYEPESTGMSRRELFRVFREMPLDRAVQSLPKLENGQDNGLFYRGMLRDMVAENAADVDPKDRPKFRVKLPVFTEKCYGCGMCEKACPQKALKVQVNDQKQILVTVEPWRCTGCGICMNACKEGAISALGTMKVSTLSKVALKKIQGYACEDCGKLRPKDAPEGVCTSCLARREMIRKRDAFLKQKEEQKAKNSAPSEK